LPKLLPEGEVEEKKKECPNGLSGSAEKQRSKKTTTSSSTPILDREPEEGGEGDRGKEDD